MNYLVRSGTGLLIVYLSACSNHMPAPVDDIRFTSKSSTKHYSFSIEDTSQLNRFHHVLPGETLFAIAWKYSLDYHDVAKINGLENFRIYPGQRLLLKKELPKSLFEPTTLIAAINSDVLNKKPDVAPKTKVAEKRLEVTSHQKSRTIKEYKHQRRTKSSPKSASINHSRVANNQIKNWIWPVNGKILQGFSNKNNQNKGLDIKAKLGSPVRATAPGKVVYSGNGLRGYGQLVIIKHNDSYLSAYAHNNKIHVSENEIVKAGQRIADLGKSGSDKAKLHFEIRYKGKPVNPLNYLPKAG